MENEHFAQIGTCLGLKWASWRGTSFNLSMLLVYGLVGSKLSWLTIGRSWVQISANILYGIGVKTMLGWLLSPPGPTLKYRVICMLDAMSKHKKYANVFFANHYLKTFLKWNGMKEIFGLSHLTSRFFLQGSRVRLRSSKLIWSQFESRGKG